MSVNRAPRAPDRSICLPVSQSMDHAYTVCQTPRCFLDSMVLKIILQIPAMLVAVCHSNRRIACASAWSRNWVTIRAKLSASYERGRCLFFQTEVALSAVRRPVLLVVSRGDCGRWLEYIRRTASACREVRGWILCRQMFLYFLQQCQSCTSHGGSD